MNKREVIGWVRDAQTGDTLPGAHVYTTVDGQIVGTATDIDGAFALPPVPLDAVITASFVGYRTLTFQNDGSAVEVMLVPGVGLDEFEVVGTRDIGTGVAGLLFALALAYLASQSDKD